MLLHIACIGRKFKDYIMNYFLALLTNRFYRQTYFDGFYFFYT